MAERISDKTLRVGKKLSKRESEYIYCLIKGMTVKQTGKVLGISYRSVETCLYRLRKIFHCHTRYDLIQKILDDNQLLREVFEKIGTL